MCKLGQYKVTDMFLEQILKTFIAEYGVFSESCCFDNILMPFVKVNIPRCRVNVCIKFLMPFSNPFPHFNFE